MRSQLNSLKALLDAISAITQVQVDGVTTLSPDQPATASATLTGDAVHFTFAIPQGQAGEPGAPGGTGGDGPPGPQGPPFAQAVVDSVDTLPPGSPASVSSRCHACTWPMPARAPMAPRPACAALAPARLPMLRISSSALPISRLRP